MTARRAPNVPGLYLVVVACLFLASAVAQAQRQSYRAYGTADGLTNLNARTLLQDHAGLLWVGTDNGLFRFDGASFREFGHADGLPSTEIHALAESPDGDLWVATQAGLVHWHNERFESVELPFHASGIHALAFDAAGTLYVEHDEGILRRTTDYAGGFLFETIVAGNVHGMLVHNNSVYFGWQGDLWRLDAMRAVAVGIAHGLPKDQWDAICRDSSGGLWVRSSSRLYQLPVGAQQFTDRSAGVPHTQDVALSVDRHGRVFVATLSGAVIIEGSHVTEIDARHGLPGDAVGPMLVDRDESLWLGMSGAGLVRRLGHGEWTSWKREDGLPNNIIWAVRHDQRGQTWVGTSGGLALLDSSDKVTRTWTMRNGLPGDRVLALELLPSGGVLVGTDPAGLTQMDENGRIVRTYGARDGLASRVMSLALDQQQHLWVLQDHRVLRSREPFSPAPMRFDVQVLPGMDSTVSFRSVRASSDGAVWIATSAGLLRYDGAAWIRYTRSNGLRDDDLDDLAVRGNALWVAYRDAIGLTSFEINGARITPQANDLLTDAVYAMSFDHQGQLWTGTDKGVRVLTDHGWHHLTARDGLVWDDTDSLAQSVDGEGNIWIGTSGGLSRFTRTRWTAPEGAPPVVISMIHAGNRTWDAAEDPVLPWSQREVTIQYSALTFTNDHPRYRYRIGGYNNNWIETTGRTVQLAALPAGHYDFQVQALGSHDIWSPVPGEFRFAIRRPWWGSWEFIGGVALAVVLLARLLWMLRIRTLIAQSERLQRIVDEQTAELRESHRRMEELAYKDLLTSLPNRRMFSDDLRRRIGTAGRSGDGFALLLIDLDLFKQVNDTYGHDAGDAVLAETAMRLQSAVRNCDTVARLGGDEFAILLHGERDKFSGGRELEAVDVVCRRILSHCAQAIHFGGRELHVACSIGIALFPADSATEDGLYKAADLALYQAKRTTRNTFCWYSSIRPIVESGSNESSKLSAEDELQLEAPALG